MSDPTADLPAEDGFRRIIREARLEMQQARSDYYRARLRGHVTPGVRQQLAESLIQYYDVMWENRPKRQDVQQAWDNSDVDEIQELVMDDRVVERPAPGDAPAPEIASEPAILTCSPEKLVSLSKELDGLAAELGFTAGVEDDRQFGRIGSEEHWEQTDEDGGN